jgi:hypothetical protein
VSKSMQFAVCYLALFALPTLAYAAVTSSPPIENPGADIKKAVILLENNRVYGCADGYELYVRPLEPKKKDATTPDRVEDGCTDADDELANWYAAEKKLIEREKRSCAL